MSVYSCPRHRYVCREHPGICQIPILSVVRCSGCTSPRQKREAPDQCVCGGKFSLFNHQCGKELQLVEEMDVEEYKLEPWFEFWPSLVEEVGGQE